jgi:hypothetical protein
MLVLHYGRSDGSRTGPAPSPASSVASTDVVVPGAIDELPGGWSAPPGPGDRLGAGIVTAEADGPASLQVPDGAAGVIAAWPTSGDAAGYGALLEVTGDPGAVVADLEDQIASHTGRDVRTTRSSPAGAEVTEVVGTGPGDERYQVVATTVGNRTWIAIEAGQDGPGSPSVTPTG